MEKSVGGIENHNTYSVQIEYYVVANFGFSFILYLFDLLFLFLMFLMTDIGQDSPIFNVDF